MRGREEIPEERKIMKALGKQNECPPREKKREGVPIGKKR